ncbi:prolyl aminopeptidase [Teichococcus deserti]|uniref:prolyl aminopeptidase n=1 Tax=Teichococcus deserti TaxID=1817963 RepID=UPI001F611A26|nr:prolyl aminopeptidase [Pseudoroseomonas deserti]
MLRRMFPPIEPHASGQLALGDGFLLSWEACGNPAGRTALVLHGGPGSGRSERARRWFDPDRFRVILFDQRGAGRSAGPEDLAANTTPHLIADIEALRRHLDVENWLVLGGSWGATLALAYAQQHPERVTGLVLHAVATTTRREIDWITRGVGRLFPREWERFAAGVPAAEREGCLAAAYNRRLLHPDPAVHHQAARDWCDWEAAILDIGPGSAAQNRFDEPAFRLRFARLVTHYWRHAAWLEEDALLQGMPKLAGIPGQLVHGRLDLGSPLATAWQLHRAWPGSRLTVVEPAGHDSRDPGMAEAICAAVAALAG